MAIATSTALALAAGAAGTAMSIKGASDAKKAQQQTNAFNLEESRRAEAENWKRYMMSRGVGLNGEPVNTVLPLWATVNQPFGGPSRRFRAIGSAAPVASPAVPAQPSTPILP